jgi:hypothetical protein
MGDPLWGNAQSAMFEQRWSVAPAPLGGRSSPLERCCLALERRRLALERRRQALQRRCLTAALGFGKTESDGVSALR